MGPEWHSDGCGLTGLYAAEVPSGSEDPKRTTWWASGYRAWEAGLVILWLGQLGVTLW